jgi:hypothetical protein
MKEQQKQNLIEMMQQDEKLGLYDDTSNRIKNATAMQQLFIELESKHPELFSTFTNDGKNFINDFYNFLDIEKEQLKKVWIDAQTDQCKQFSSNYKGITFDEYYNLIKRNETNGN